MKFNVTLMIPQTSVLEAADLQDAHNQVTAMLKRGGTVEGEPVPKMHSIEKVDESVVVSFGPSPAEE